MALLQAASVTVGATACTHRAALRRHPTGAAAASRGRAGGSARLSLSSPSIRGGAVATRAKKDADATAPAEAPAAAEPTIAPAPNLASALESFPTPADDIEAADALVAAAVATEIEAPAPAATDDEADAAVAAHHAAAADDDGSDPYSQSPRMYDNLARIFQNREEADWVAGAYTRHTFHINLRRLWSPRHRNHPADSTNGAYVEPKSGQVQAPAARASWRHPSNGPPSRLGSSRA